MLSHLIQAQASGFALRIATVSSHSSEVIVAEDDCRLIEVGATIGIRRNDQGVERESHRAIAVLGVLNERAASLGEVHFAHGRLTPGTGAGRAGGCARVGPGLVFGRVRVVSAAGSR